MKAVERKVPLTLCEQPVPCRYEETPEFTAEDYSRRIEAAWAAPQAADMDVLIVYGDREHFSNVHYFTGYDVRWEETLLLLARGVRPVLLVGNEGLGYTAGLTAELDVKMYQSFSLMGQPNDRRSRKLTDYFSDFGIGPGVKVGLIGWKVYRPELFEKGELLTDIPYYIVRALASLTGTDHLYNVTDLLTDCEHGLKHNVSAKEIVQYELAGTTVSTSVKDCPTTWHSPPDTGHWFTAIPS